MPDVSAIASFTGVYDGYDVEKRSPDRGELFGKKGQPTFVFQEVEMGLQAVVDPYFRADVFVSFTPDGVDVEEAYATTLALPASLQLRAGKFFTPFGRMNQQHPHVWEFVDPPLARGRLLAQGDRCPARAWSPPGWRRLPWFAQLELAAQTTTPFDGLSPEFTGTGRLLQYFPMTEARTASGSGSRRRGGGRRAAGGFRDLGGADVYFRHRLPQLAQLPGSPGRALPAQVPGMRPCRRLHPAELRAPGPSTVGGRRRSGGRTPSSATASGTRRRPPPGSPPRGPSGGSPGVLDWYPSEFSRVALEASYDRLPGGKGGFEGLLHFEFGIGAHGAHPF